MLVLFRISAILLHKYNICKIIPTKVDLCFDCDWLRKALWVVSSRMAASPSVIIEKRAQAFSR